MTKTLYITTGTNEAECETKARTEAGYIKVAGRLCGDEISTGMNRLKIKVIEDGEIIFEAVRDVVT